MKRILSAQDAKDIILSKLPATELAKQYNVSQQRISQIRPIRQYRVSRNKRDAVDGADSVCRLCMARVHFDTTGDGRLVEICECGHYIVVSGVEIQVRSCVN